MPWGWGWGWGWAGSNTFVSRNFLFAIDADVVIHSATLEAVESV